jgi:hypothetical protein
VALIFDTVNASVLAIAERLGEPKLATLGPRQFALMRPGHVDTLELLPTLGAGDGRRRRNPPLRNIT